MASLWRIMISLISALHRHVLLKLEKKLSGIGP